MDVLAKCEVCLDVVNQVEDVLLEVAVVELAEDCHQPDYKVWAICHLFCVFSCQIEQKRVINELVKGVLSQEHSSQGEVIQVFDQFVHFVEGINVTYRFQASCNVFQHLLCLLFSLFLPLVFESRLLRICYSCLIHAVISHICEFVILLNKCPLCCVTNLI